MLHDVVRLQKGVAQAKGLVLSIQVDDDVPECLIGDALRIRQVLFNLINNAVKFTEHGRIDIHIDWQDASLSLDVCDTGPGISETSRVRLFHRFEQDDSPQRSIGNGLGLAICNELVGMMGGSMTLESTLGEGSSFRVRLPLQVMSETAPPPSNLWYGRTLDVLLVDSDATVAAAICDMLEQQGHRVRCASHGLNALAELSVALCDVILLDLNLPGIDGFQVAQLIRHGEGAGEYLPIIAMTTHDGEEGRVHARQVGIDGLLHKPLTGEQLSSALQEALSARPSVWRETNLA
jgi:CheY-like chemotaxis protein